MTEELKPPPSLHLAGNFRAFLRRHAQGLSEPTRGAVEQAAELIDLQRREIERLGRESDAAAICEQQAERWTDERARYVAHECAAAIRAAP